MIAASTSVEGQTLDQAAFLALTRPVLPVAYRLAVAMLRSEVEAEDAVQEAFFKAWRHRERFRPGAAMQPWLLAIVANECRAIRRSRWWSVLKRAEEPDAGAAPSGVEDQDNLALRRAIRSLPHDQKLAVVLRYYLDLSFEEVAQVLKISTKAAKSRTYRAIERLRLDPEVIDDEGE